MRAVLDDQTDVQAGPGKPEAGDRPIALLILGTGGMAGRHLEQFSAIPGCTIVAACDVNATRAKTFAELHGTAHVFDDLGKALEWGCFDAVINATPDGVHKATSLEIIAAGKPIYCEKRSCPETWCRNTDLGGAEFSCQAARTGSLTRGLSLTTPRVSSVM